MVGLIWTIQLVHYPLFALVGFREFPAFEQAHTRRMAWLLIVPAVTEIATGAALVVYRPSDVPVALVIGAGAALAVIWVTTGLVQARIHSALQAGFDAGLISRLVTTNWLRTGLWTVRGGAVVAMVAV